MSFNPDPSKQTREVSFSRKINKTLHLPLVFNNSNVIQIKCYKHLRMILDSRHNFNEYLETYLEKLIVESV